ncbi:lytic transglycosylase domain-containing protein [Beijerinckia indica]|uniref:Lytic transglycosylase catalytic n=1 Tax=Beijerinckia indica subsp. indica (strain ATCC 9039 / DSM 1715 / NCIMB 8712) TaxID=395963 RepID=B2IJU3_BEII9|nr:lytic transglycosylase domain-containing protein [Beijerinckia indica]ACB96318.1 Lytic transglycosylase catalytic [Beijerinckia indica subsp. indica ATCC 9039]
MIGFPIRAAAIACLPLSAIALADKVYAETTPALDAKIAHYAAMHGVPERLVHRIVRRESKGNPHLVSRGNLGLMQIKYATARSMGYSGSPQGLLDAETNLAYAVPYLANAYRLAGGNEDRAVTLYAAGYYYTAKSKNMLGELRTADSAPISSRPIMAMAPAAREMSRDLALARSEYEMAHQQSGSQLASTPVEMASSSMPVVVPLPPVRPTLAGEAPREERNPGEYQVASLDAGMTGGSFPDKAPVVAPLPPPRPFSAY